MSDVTNSAEAPQSSDSLQLVSIPAVTEQDKETGARAVGSFLKKDYESCMKYLKFLMQTRSNDPKVIHNKAVVEYCQSGYTKTDEFKEVVAKVCSMYSQVQIENIDTLDDVDQCVLYYNYAVLLYYLRQYREAITIVDKLFQYMEPLEENLSKRVLLFLIELYLITHQAEKAMRMIMYAEKHLLGNGAKSQNLDKSDSSGYTSDDIRSQISQYKVRCHIMVKSMKSCKREVKSLMNSIGMVTSVIYLKSYFEYLRGNLHKAIKLLNSMSSPSHVTVGQCLSVMYYNNMACLHFQLRKHHLGAFYLRRAVQENANAIKELPKINASKSLTGRPVQSLASSKHHELLYNMGIQLLHCGKPQAAFDCLIEVVQVYQTNPRLWLRIAECCVMAYRETNEKDKQLEELAKVIQGSIGSGVHRKLILGTCAGAKVSNNSSSLPAMPTPTLPFAALCLRNANSLLQVALSPQLQTSGENEQAEQAKAAKCVDAEPGNPLRPQEVANLKCTVLVNSAYVALCLNDNLSALQYAEKLMKQPKLSAAHRYLGHMYMAEALVKLDRIADSIQNLIPDSVKDVSTLPPDGRMESTGDKEASELSELPEQSYPWHPRDVSQARAILQYNLACAHAVRGEFHKAMDLLSQSTQNIGQPFPVQVHFLKIYLHLIEGHKKTAQGIIKDNFGHVTPNRYPSQ